MKTIMKIAISLSVVLLVALTSSVFGQDFSGASDVIAFGKVKQASSESVILAITRFTLVPKQKAYPVKRIVDGREVTEEVMRMVEERVKIEQDLKLSSEDYLFQKLGQSVSSDRRPTPVAPHQIDVGTPVILFRYLSPTRTEFYTQFIRDDVLLAIEKQGAKRHSLVNPGLGTDTPNVGTEAMPPVPADDSDR